MDLIEKEACILTKYVAVDSNRVLSKIGTIEDRYWIEIQRAVLYSARF